MLSRWTNFLTEDGEKSWRTRDAEFEQEIKTKDELLKKWNTGWDCVLNAVENLSVEDLSKKVTIRQEEHSVIDAINRQLAHYAYHIGQLIYVAKLIKDEKWETLSIARGKSKEFNAGMKKAADNNQDN